MSAEARAERKILAGLYANLPSKDHFETAIRYEQTKMQAVQTSTQGLFQIASLAAQIAGNLPPSNQKNIALIEKAQGLVDKYLTEAHLQVDEYIVQAQKAREVKPDAGDEPEAS